MTVASPISQQFGAAGDTALSMGATSRALHLRRASATVAVSDAVLFSCGCGRSLERTNALELGAASKFRLSVNKMTRLEEPNNSEKK